MEAELFEKLERPSGSAEEWRLTEERRDGLIAQQTRPLPKDWKNIARDGRIIADYDANTGRCTVSRIKGKQLNTMGYPIGGGRFGLHPEEAVYLLEYGAADIRLNGRSLDLKSSYGILLEKNNISWAQYLVYSHLMQSGYIVIRYGQNAGKYLSLGANNERYSVHDDPRKAKRARVVDPGSDSSEKTATVPRLGPVAVAAQGKKGEAKGTAVHKRFPTKLLDQFPDLRGGSVVSLPTVSNYSACVDTIAGRMESLSCVVNADQFTAKPAHMRKHVDRRKMVSSPWIQLRPRHWRLLPAHVLKSGSWAEFVAAREKHLDQMRRAPARKVNNLHIVGSETAGQSGNFRSDDYSSPYRLLYDVYSANMHQVYSHKMPPLPTHRLCIIDVRVTTPPTAADLLALHSQCSDSVPIHIATFDCGQVSFFDSRVGQGVCKVPA